MTTPNIEETKTVADYIKIMCKTSSFKNLHGEKFNIHSDGKSVFMSGDEINMMVDDKYKVGRKYIPLFNPHFSVWSKEELYKLGKALMKLHE